MKSTRSPSPTESESDTDQLGHPPKGQSESVASRRRALALGASKERLVAELLGTRRVRRHRYERAGDVEPVRLPCGVVLAVEVKARKKIPTLVTKAIAQAANDGPRGAVACAVLAETGKEPLLVVPLRTFRIVAGIDGPVQADPQIAISFPDLGADERRVLEVIADRLRMGGRQYGALDIAGDPRDWAAEALEEALDLAVYIGAELRRRAG